MQIGAQLYTVRNHCQNLDDFALTLRKVADIGYRTVQVSGTCAFEAGWLKDQLEQNGYKVVSLEELKAAQTTILPQQKELTEEELALFDHERYAIPATSDPLNQGSTHIGTMTDLNGAAFVGDSVTTGLEGYVDMRRREDPAFLPDTIFISPSTMSGLSTK